MSEGIDYSYSKPSAQSIVDAGYTFVGRYVGPASDVKSLTRNEVNDLQAHDLHIVCFFEQDAERALGGYYSGKYDGYVVGEYLAECGLPADTVVYFTVDFDMTADEVARVTDYFKGVNASRSRSRCGVYGDYDVCNLVIDAGYADHVFQTVAWSSGLVSEHAEYIQTGRQATVDGIVVDIDAVSSQFVIPTESSEPVIVPFTLPAGENVHYVVPCVGCTKLRFHLAYDDQPLTLLQLVPEGDTPSGPGGGQMAGGWSADDPGNSPWLWVPDRDGPWLIPAGATQLIMRYSATHPVNGSVADQ